MKKVEKKIGLSLLVHIIWFLLIVYMCGMMEGAAATKIMKFLVLTENVPIAVPIQIVIAYFFVLGIYFVKPLHEKKDKQYFWLFTTIFTLMVVIPMYANYFS